MIGRHFKTNELAELLGMSADTLYRAVDRGDLQPRRIGRDLWFDETDVEAWLERNTVRNVSRVVPFRRENRASTTRRSA